MGEQSTTQYPRTSAALQRLEEAVARLERASAQGGGQRAELKRQLETLREDCAEMEGVNREVTKRLDAAILRLKGLVGE